MSMVDIIARALAIRALEGPVDLSDPDSAAGIGIEGGQTVQDVAHMAPARLAAASAGLTPSANVPVMTSSGQNVPGVGMARFIQDSSVNAAFASAHPHASFVTASGRGYRLDTEQRINPCMFGADPTGALDSTQAFLAAQAYLSAATPRGGILELPPGTFDVRGSTTGLAWTLSNGGMRGAGMESTLIKGASGKHPFQFSSSNLTNVHICDLTLEGPVASGVPGTVKNVIFERVRFVTNTAEDVNALKLVADGMSGGFLNIFFIDCEFGPCGRMGVELQNHNNSLVKFENVAFVRPRVIGTGAAGTFGMGISLSGFGDNVLIDQPYFDGCDGPLIENAGFNNVTVRGLKARAATLASGERPLSYTSGNTYREMLGCVVDGFRLLPELQAAPWQSGSGRPAMSSALFFENCHGLLLKDIVMRIDNAAVGTNGITLGSSGKPCKNVTVKDCDIASNSNKALIEFLSTSGEHRVENCTLSQTHATAPALAVFGSGKAVIEGGRFSATGGTITSITGSGLIAVGDDINGLPKRYRQVVTIAAGSTSSSLITHGLPTNAAKQTIRCHVVGQTFGASIPYATKHTSNTQARANVTTAPSGGTLSVEIEVEYDY